MWHGFDWFPSLLLCTVLRQSSNFRESHFTFNMFWTNFSNIGNKRGNIYSTTRCDNGARCDEEFDGENFGFSLRISHYFDFEWMNELVKYCYYECFGWDYHDKMIAYKTHHIHLRPFIFTLIQIKSTSCIFNTIIVQNRIEATRSMLYHICLFVHKIRNTNRTSHRYVMSQRFHLGLWMS